MDIKNSGFTLLEALLTIVLVTLGFVFLLQALSRGLFAGSDNENMLVSINLAQEKIEEIRNKAYVDIANETKAVVTGFPAFQRETVVTLPQAGLKQVSVNVYWSAQANELNVSLVTYASDI